MEVTLVGPEGDKVMIKRVKDGKKFTISLDSLSQKSKDEVVAMLAELKNSYPPIESSVVIGKRRKHENGSSYMKKMVITGKITLTNKDRNHICPPCKASLVFIGQDQKDEDRFKVLSNQQLDITPTPKGASVETTAFVTSYDSDNKGAGNIGGFKYVGYLLVVFDQEGKILFTKTLYSKLREAMKHDVTFAKNMTTYKEELILNEAMKAEK